MDTRELKKGEGFMRKKRIMGGILIILGLIWLLESFKFIQVDLTLIIVSSFLYILYFLSGNKAQKRVVGLLIAGSIVLMLGVQSILDDLFFLGDLEGVFFFLLIGTAFWIVYFVHTRYLVQGGKWPVYVGSALYTFAGFIFITENFNQGFFRIVWAFGLIGIGIYILFKR